MTVRIKRSSRGRYITIPTLERATKIENEDHTGRAGGHNVTDFFTGSESLSFAEGRNFFVKLKAIQVERYHCSQLNSTIILWEGIYPLS